MATSADVISFRLAYPEFKALTDADVAGALDDADIWLDPQMWSPRDFPLARYLLTGHFLALLAQLLANQAALGDLMGFTNQTLKMTAFGERRVAFGQLAGEKEATKSKYASGPDIQFAETPYGQSYLLLRSRNIMPIITV
jgi:hypothetical protein